MIRIPRKIALPRHFATTSRYMFTGFAIISLIGAYLLMTPLAVENGVQPLNFIDALFTAVSAVTTTGLIVTDTPNTFSYFGEAVILLLIQIGGLGYMAFAIFFADLLGLHPSLAGQSLFQFSVNGSTLDGIARFSKKIITVTFLIEFVGAIALFPSFLNRNLSLHRGALQSAWESLFHSISAFCTAGFSLYSDSLSYWVQDPWVNSWIILLSLLGALGFFTIEDVLAVWRKEKKILTLQSKIALTFTFLVLVFGVVTIFGVEWVRGHDFGGPIREIFPSLFQAVSAMSGAGFNTIEMGILQNASIFILMILMFIGGVPGGTAGGIKMTTFGVTLASVWSSVRGREDVNIFRRRLSDSSLKKASMVIFLSSGVVLAGTLLLTLTEKFHFIATLFEVVSAFGTVGLSVGITGEVSPFGRLVLTGIMFIGRVGPMTAALALAEASSLQYYRYVEEEVAIG